MLIIGLYNLWTKCGNVLATWILGLRSG